MLKAVRRLLDPDLRDRRQRRGRWHPVEEAERLKPEVIVLDLSLPTVTGLDACRELSQTHPAIKVIVFSASGDPEVEYQARAAGAAAVLSRSSRPSS
jgi:DNA-binding NarL/FixJ family response regulator